MATRTITTWTDDVDGSRAEHTVTFALDGVTYELDLSEANRAALRASIARYSAAARRVRHGIAAPTPVRVDAGVDTRAVRQWARVRGIDLPARGRIPQDVIDQFHAAGY